MGWTSVLAGGENLPFKGRGLDGKGQGSSCGWGFLLPVLGTTQGAVDLEQMDQVMAEGCGLKVESGQGLGQAERCGASSCLSGGHRGRVTAEREGGKGWGLAEGAGPEPVPLPPSMLGGAAAHEDHR